MTKKKDLKQKQVLFQEKNGYHIVQDMGHVTVMKNELNEYIKVDEDGMVVTFKPLNEQNYQ